MGQNRSSILTSKNPNFWSFSRIAALEKSNIRMDFDSILDFGIVRSARLSGADEHTHRHATHTHGAQSAERRKIMANNNTSATILQAQAVATAHAIAQAMQALDAYRTSLLAFADADAHEDRERMTTYATMGKGERTAAWHALVDAGFPVGKAVVAEAHTVAPAPKQSETPTERTGEVCMWVREGTYVSTATAGGKFIGRSGIRKILNARIRNAGGKYDKAHKAYKFPNEQAAIDFVNGTSAEVTDAQFREYMGTLERKHQQ